MEKDKNVLHGVKWGISIGLVYCVILYLRYSLGATNPIWFALFATVGFITVLILLLICALQRRKKSGGFIDLKDIFQTLFVTVLILELFYTIFNYIYLQAIDPNFFEKFRDSTEALLQQQGVSQEKIDKQLEGFKVDPILNYLWSVAVTGVFAMIIGLIVRRKRPPFANEQTVFQTNES
jgi:hypothetical protein